MNLANNNIWYHLVPKGTNMREGIISPYYMLKNNAKALFRKSTDKYRERLCKFWNIYPGRNPKSLTDEEIAEGLIEARGKNGLKQIYLFKFPPTEDLGPNMKNVLDGKDVYEVDLSKVHDLENIDWGYVDSNPDHGKISKDWYSNLTKEEYFAKYDDNTKGLLFAPINHISIVTTSGKINRTAIKKINKESVVTEKKIERKNDKGEEIPEVCPKCGSKIGLYIKGEPVWLCSNKKCNTYFGTLPCNESTGDFINGTVDEIQKIEDSLNKSDDGYKSKHKTYKELIYRDVQYTKSDTEKSHGGWIEMYSKPEYSTDDCNVATIAISVDPESRGTGLSDKLVKGALSATHKLGIDRIEWYCKKSNTGSYKLAKRAGFKEEPDMSTSTDWVLSYGKKLPKDIKEFTEDFIVESGEFAGKKRSELPDSVFGIPEERKYPMPDKKHVISAIKLFNHVEPKYEEDLAKRIIYRARKYKIDLSFVGEKNRLYKYIHENTEVFESSMEDILNSFDVYTEARREIKNLEDFKKSYHFEPINMAKDDTAKIVDADIKATGLITMGDKKYFCIIGKNIETCAFTKNKDNRVIEELVKKYPKLKETIRNDKLNGYMYGSEYLSGTRYNSQKKHAFIMSHEQGHQELGHTTPDYRLSLDDETIIKNAKAKFNRNLESASNKFKSNEKDNNALATYKKEVKDAYKKYISEVDRNLSSKDLNANEIIRSKMREEARKIFKKYELGWHSRVDEFEADLFAKIKSNQSSDQIINTLSNMYRQDEQGKNIEDIKNSDIRIKEDIESRQKALNDKDIEKYKKAYDLSDKSLDKKIMSEKEAKLRAKEINKKRDLISYNNKRERIKTNIQDSLNYIKDDEEEIERLQGIIQNNYKGISPGREKIIDKRLEDYKQTLKDDKKELDEYKAKLKSLPYRTESSEGVEDMDIVSKMFESFFGEPLFKKSEAESFVDSFFEESNNDSDIPDMIEPEVKKLEAKGYQVKYASPGHENTTFKNDKNDDKIINGKYRSTGRIIFSRNYNFKNTPKGWEWKSIDNGEKKALYVKPYTYNEELGSKEQVFKRWREFYLKSLVDWIEELPEAGTDNNENKKDENFSAS